MKRAHLDLNTNFPFQHDILKYKNGLVAAGAEGGCEPDKANERGDSELQELKAFLRALRRGIHKLNVRRLPDVALYDFPLLPARILTWVWTTSAQPPFNTPRHSHKKAHSHGSRG